MKHIRTSRSRRRFEVLLSTGELQAAMMTLGKNGASDDEPSNEHPASEQWLFVIAGNGQAIVSPQKGHRRTVALRPGSLLLIQKGEKHQIKQTGEIPLKTINFYAPPAYRANGDLRGKS